MLRRIRRKLRQIEYYSATRPRTTWSRAFDRAFIAAFVLAWPAVLITDATVTRVSNYDTVSGRLFQLETVMKAVLTENLDSPMWQEEIPVAVFHLHADEQRRGWPFTSSRQRLRRRVDLDVFIESKPRPDAQLADDDPIAVALEEMLADSRRAAVVAEWPTTASERTITWRGLLGGGLVWWVILTAAAGSAITAARFASFRLRIRVNRRRDDWRQSGRCLRCGYDLRGLEFNERCPECGALVE